MDRDRRTLVSGSVCVRESVCVCVCVCVVAPLTLANSVQLAEKNGNRNRRSERHLAQSGAVSRVHRLQVTATSALVRTTTTSNTEAEQAGRQPYSTVSRRQHTHTHTHTPTQHLGHSCNDNKPPPRPNEPPSLCVCVCVRARERGAN